MPTRSDQILDAAERLLRYYGRSKTTVSEIAREAGIAVGSVYLEFENKDAIVGALSERCRRSILDAMQKAAEKELPYPERLRHVVGVRLKRFHALAKKGDHARDLFCNQCEAVRQVHEEFRQGEAELIAELLVAGTKAGEFAVEDAISMARAILRVYDAFLPTADHPTPAGDLPTTHALILFGLVRRG
jgi:AcrR family transcriptional regulator